MRSPRVPFADAPCSRRAPVRLQSIRTITLPVWRLTTGLAGCEKTRDSDIMQVIAKFPNWSRRDRIQPSRCSSPDPRPQTSRVEEGYSRARNLLLTSFNGEKDATPASLPSTRSSSGDIPVQPGRPRPSNKHARGDGLFRRPLLRRRHERVEAAKPPRRDRLRWPPFGRLQAQQPRPSTLTNPPSDLGMLTACTLALLHHRPGLLSRHAGRCTDRLPRPDSKNLPIISLGQLKSPSLICQPANPGPSAHRCP